MTTKIDGFTLLELLISASLIAILLAIATPSFAAIIQKVQITSLELDLKNSLNLARSSAINHSRTVLVCQLTNTQGNNCIESHTRNVSWKYGWLVFVDLNDNDKLDKADRILHKQQPNDQIAVVFNQNGRLRFFPSGSARSAGFYVCHRQSNYVSHIKLLYSGRSRSTQSTSAKHLKTCQKALKTKL